MILIQKFQNKRQYRLIIKKKPEQLGRIEQMCPLQRNGYNGTNFDNDGQRCLLEDRALSNHTR